MVKISNCVEGKIGILRECILKMDGLVLTFNDVSPKRRICVKGKSI